jgi:hypothetical protein
VELTLDLLAAERDLGLQVRFGCFEHLGLLKWIRFDVSILLL